MQPLISLKEPHNENKWRKTWCIHIRIEVCNVCYNPKEKIEVWQWFGNEWIQSRPLYWLSFLIFFKKLHEIFPMIFYEPQSHCCILEVGRMHIAIMLMHFSILHRQLQSHLYCKVYLQRIFGALSNVFLLHFKYLGFLKIYMKSWLQKSCKIDHCVVYSEVFLFLY